MAGDSKDYDASYRGARTQEHPRFGRGGNDISATEAGRKLKARTGEVDAALNEMTSPAVRAPSAPVTDAPKGGISFEKADPERAKKRKAGPPANML